jgi:hypothetical protein
MLTEFIRRECASDVWFAEQGVFEELREQLRNEDQEGALLAIRRRADAHYRELWQACSTLEKLLLLQLAEEDVVNLHSDDVIAELVRKGLVLNDPHPRLMNESFRRFVLPAASEMGVKDLEHTMAGGANAWRNFVWPVLLITGLFLLLTQQKYFDNILTPLSTVATGVAGLFGVFNRVRAAVTGAKVEEG